MPQVLFQIVHTDWSIMSYEIYTANVRGEFKGGGGARRACAPTIFCNHLFFAMTLKNYKLCYLKLN